MYRLKFPPLLKITQTAIDLEFLNYFLLGKNEHVFET